MFACEQWLRRWLNAALVHPVYLVAMTKKILRTIIFFCVPVAILITTMIHRDPKYQGKPAAIWVEEIRTDQDAALNALQHMGKGALPALREMLNFPAPTERCRAAWVMGRLDPAVANAAVPDLISVLDDGNVVLQSEAMHSLSRIGITNVDLVPKLMAKLTNDTTGAFAAELLNSIQKKRKSENLPSFQGDGYDYGMACLASPRSCLRLNGAIQLASVAQQDERAKIALQSLLKDKDVAVRAETMRLMTNPDALSNFKLVSE